VSVPCVSRVAALTFVNASDLTEMENEEQQDDTLKFLHMVPPDIQSRYSNMLTERSKLARGVRMVRPGCPVLDLW
jgi:hypothetical protein